MKQQELGQKNSLTMLFIQKSTYQNDLYYGLHFFPVLWSLFLFNFILNFFFNFAPWILFWKYSMV